MTDHAPPFELLRSCFSPVEAMIRRRQCRVVGDDNGCSVGLMSSVGARPSWKTLYARQYSVLLLVVLAVALVEHCASVVPPSVSHSVAIIQNNWMSTMNSRRLRLTTSPCDDSSYAVSTTPLLSPFSSSVNLSDSEICADYDVNAHVVPRNLADVDEEVGRDRKEPPSKILILAAAATDD